MSSTALYNLSTGGYVMSLAIFALHVVNTRRLLLRFGVALVAASFLVQTAGMVYRWMEAGVLEVHAAEKTLGAALSGWSWFVVFTQHPPWSNLYEIMIYMSWGITMATLACELKWQLAWVRQIGIILALMALGMASLNDATIKPLVPALKSWWIMIHVISASIAYASGSLAAFISLFAIIKSRVHRTQMMGCAVLFLGCLIFLLGGGLRLLMDQAYYVKLLSYAGDNIRNVMDMSKEKAASYLIPMPMVGPLLLLVVVIHILVGVFLLWRFSKIKDEEKLSGWAVIACLVSVLATGLIMFGHDIKRTAILVDGNISHHLFPAGPWFIGFKSHPWSLGLFIFVVFIEAILAIYWYWPQMVTKRLPDSAVLESAAYKAISLAFFLMSVVLITGALWAHYAWGRYWAWDPKETGALAIWLTYAIYLHARRTKGLSHTFSSVIGIIGFFVILIGFLGVNLGLFADGLHTYGNS